MNKNIIIIISSMILICITIITIVLINIFSTNTKTKPKLVQEIDRTRIGNAECLPNTIKWGAFCVTCPPDYDKLNVPQDEKGNYQGGWIDQHRQCLSSKDPSISADVIKTDIGQKYCPQGEYVEYGIKTGCYQKCPEGYTPAEKAKCSLVNQPDI